MGKKLNLVGQKYGRWEVIDESPNKNGRTYWHCRCECGKEKDVPTASLRDGSSQSCGCLQKEKTANNNSIDLIGKRFNRLIVESKTPLRHDGMIIWHCKCDCGNEIDVPTSYLTTGDTSSCGCYQRDRIRETNMVDITNQRFGKLIALYPTSKKIGKSKNVIWHCKCDCGNECDINSASLRKGLTVSCGCIKSIGEQKISELLTNNNIPYEMQKIFQTCRFPDSNALARFDFYVNNKYLIEYDGEQHFTYNGRKWNTKENFESSQKRDNYKNQWCKNNNIPLIRIPYTHYTTLCIEDLLLDTSTCLI